MLLIQRLISVFCFALLILKGVSADMQRCTEALKVLFHETERGLRLFDPYFNLLDYYFLPDVPLMCILTPKKNNQTRNSAFECKKFGSRLTVPDPDKSETQNGVVIQNRVKFIEDYDLDFEAVQFTLRHSDTREGTATFICRGEVCDNSISVLRAIADGSGKLPCLDQLKASERFMYTTVRNQIEATFLDSRYSLFDSKLILKPFDWVPFNKVFDVVLGKDMKSITFEMNAGEPVEPYRNGDEEIFPPVIDVIKAADAFKSIYSEQARLNFKATGGDTHNEEIKKPFLTEEGVPMGDPTIDEKKDASKAKKDKATKVQVLTPIQLSKLTY